MTVRSQIRSNVDIPEADKSRDIVAHFVYVAKIRNEFYSATKQIKI